MGFEEEAEKALFGKCHWYFVNMIHDCLQLKDTYLMYMIRPSHRIALWQWKNIIPNVYILKILSQQNGMIVQTTGGHIAHLFDRREKIAYMQMFE